MILNFQKLRDQAIVPERATVGSAGLDLCACLDAPVTILPGKIAMIPTGLSCAPSESDVALMIYARSGLACKYGIGLANGVGVVDADYRGEICVALINQSASEFTVTDGMRIAQLVVMPILCPTISLVSELPDTERGSGGFGSTGL